MRKFLPACILIFLVLGFLSSCKKDDTSGIPSYVKIDSITVETNYSKEGSSSSNVADAWFYANDEHLGIFELPTEVPVLLSGNTNLTTFGGIKVSGVSSIRRSYPFYEAYRIDTTLIEEETVSIKPVLRYKENTTFVWMEDFDDISISIDSTSGSKTGFTRIYGADSVFEGNASAGSFMEGANNYFIGKSTQRFALPKNGDDIYLELNYRSNTSIQILVMTHTTSGSRFLTPSTVIRPKVDASGNAEWNKMYIFLAPTVSARVDGFEYEIYFESWLSSGQTSGYFLLDNIKLIY